LLNQLFVERFVVDGHTVEIEKNCFERHKETAEGEKDYLGREKRSA